MLFLDAHSLREASNHFRRRAENLVVNGGLSEREVEPQNQMKAACDRAAKVASDLEELEAAIIEEIKRDSTLITVSAVSRLLPTELELDWAPSHLGEVREPIRVRCELHMHSESNSEATYSVHWPEVDFDRPALRERDVMPAGVY